MEDRTDGPSFIFNCNCWIGKGKDDLQKYLLPEKNGKLMNKFSFDERGYDSVCPSLFVIRVNLLHPYVRSQNTVTELSLMLFFV